MLSENNAPGLYVKDFAMGSLRMTDSYEIKTIDQLTNIYGQPLERALNKVTDHISAPGKDFIAASPFLILATAGPKGIDCSPKGDQAGFVKLQGDKCILMPDRKGNNRIDGMKNIIFNPKVGIIFMIPGLEVTYRVNGTARITTDPDILNLFLVQGKPPCSVLSIEVETAHHHCTKALVRSNLWQKGAEGRPEKAPDMAAFAASLMPEQNLDQGKYEEEYQKRVKETLY